MRNVLIAALCGSLFLAGCGGTTSPSHSNASDATASPVADLASPAPSVAYHHRRHHRHHHANTSAEDDENTTVAGGAPVAGDAVAAAQSIGANAVASAPGKYPCNDNQFVAYRSQFANGTLQGDREVDVCGIVTKVLPERDTRSGLHGYYDLQVAPGSVIEIVSDLGEMNAPAWPWVKVGDYSYVQGRYYYDSASSQGIDWTHHGTSRSWPTAGYVVVGGTQYQ